MHCSHGRSWPRGGLPARGPLPGEPDFRRVPSDQRELDLLRAPLRLLACREHLIWHQSRAHTHTHMLMLVISGCLLARGSHSNCLLASQLFFHSCSSWWPQCTGSQTKAGQGQGEEACSLVPVLRSAIRPEWAGPTEGWTAASASISDNALAACTNRLQGTIACECSLFHIFRFSIYKKSCFITFN